MPNLFEKIFKPEKSDSEKSLEKITPEQEEKDLLEKKIIKLTPLKPESGHLNPVFLVGMEDGLRAVFKKTLRYKRERAAYLINRALGFNLVPPTVIRTIKDKTGQETTGSLQKFIPEAETGEEMGFSQTLILKKAKNF